MDRRWWRLGVLLLGAPVFQGCVSVHAPLEAGKDYPNTWAQLETLGPECKSVDGTYLNEGVTFAADGVARPLLLTSVFDIRSDARTVSLSVRTRRLDSNGDAFITVGIVPGGDAAALREFEGCFCIRQTLACTQLAEAYWSLPYVGLGGAQKNAYFSMAHDHSLVARLQNYHADVIFGIPVFGKQEPWARFNRMAQ